MAARYRFYLLEDGDYIAAVRVCECTNDAEALLEAEAVLQASTHPAVEVWNGSRRVGMISKPAARQSPDQLNGGA
jgi:hypothetical protein